MRPAFRALPGGVCPCPHWGYVLRGSVTFRYPGATDRPTLTVGAGEVYYAPPGHVPSAAAHSEIVEFSPAGARRLGQCLIEAAEMVAGIPSLSESYFVKGDRPD